MESMNFGLFDKKMKARFMEKYGEQPMLPVSVEGF